MQKKIIALAIAAALTAPAVAFAEVTVYGQANTSIDMLKDGAATNSTSSNQLNSNSSRLGFKGSDDLGGGLSAIWQMEAGIGTDTGAAGAAPTSTSTSTSSFPTTMVEGVTCDFDATDPVLPTCPVTTTTTTTTTAAALFNRNTYIGLKSATMGTVMLGNNDTAYKSATRALDVFGDGIADNRGNQSTGGAFGTTMMGGGHDARVKNALNYVSPKLGDLSIAVSTVFGAETSPQPSTTAKKGSLMSLAASYAQGPIFAALAYQTVKAGSAGTGDLAPTVFGLTAVDDKTTALKLGGSYKMDAMSIGAVFENIKSEKAVGSVETKGTNLYLGGKFAMSSTDAIKAAYTSKGSTKTAGVDNKNKATEIALGYDHAMSKATTVYALFAKVTRDGATADPSVISAGVRHAF